MKKSGLFVFAVLSIVSTLTVSAQGKKCMKEMKEVTITGEVIDQKCYLTGMNGARGEAHKECAISCIKGGLPIGVLEDKTEKVYTVVPKAGMKGANEELVQYAAETVKLTGMVVHKGGQNLLVYTKVEPVK
ncbi:MAG: hypothetical protein HY277_09950 [Ignavibacteriales bacterium]|nr:hypothetical protein [Ignavibacteriales bacterium]